MTSIDYYAQDMANLHKHYSIYAMKLYKYWVDCVFEKLYKMIATAQSACVILMLRSSSRALRLQIRAKILIG